MSKYNLVHLKLSAILKKKFMSMTHFLLERYGSLQNLEKGEWPVQSSNNTTSQHRSEPVFKTIITLIQNYLLCTAANIRLYYNIFSIHILQNIEKYDLILSNFNVKL